MLVGSLSKSYCMAGWRAGFLAAPAAFVKAVGNLQSHTASNACNIVQQAALEALHPSGDGFVADVRAELESQRALAMRLLSEIPELPFVRPEGAFYLFPDASALLGRSFQGTAIGAVDALAEMLLEHAHIAVVPGSAFGSERHVRISYAIPPAEISAGMESLNRFVSSLD